RGLRGAYESHHDATITDEALVAAAGLSDRYKSAYQLPDKAIHLSDQAAAKVRLRSGPSGPDLEGLRRELAELDAEKDAAVVAEEYQRAAELKVRADDLHARLAELDGTNGETGEPDAPAPSPAVVGETDVAAVVAARTGIPVGELVAG